MATPNIPKALKGCYKLGLAQIDFAEDDRPESNQVAIYAEQVQLVWNYGSCELGGGGQWVALASQERRLKHKWKYVLPLRIIVVALLSFGTFDC